jgi:hypothetical protein
MRRNYFLLTYVIWQGILIEAFIYMWILWDLVLNTLKKDTFSRLFVAGKISSLALHRR